MGSNPIQIANASVAQSVEQGTENPRVIGSIPIGGTKEYVAVSAIAGAESCIFFSCGFSSSGRAPPCQGGGSEFEPRNPLHCIVLSLPLERPLVSP